MINYVLHSCHEGLSLFWDGLMQPTVSINFTKVLQPDFVANFSNCYSKDCHAVVGRSVEITTIFPLDGAVVQVCNLNLKGEFSEIY